MATLAEVKDYLGDSSWSDADIQGALDAETAAQNNRCQAITPRPADLDEALKRRVARNLAARAVPLQEFSSFDSGATVQRVTRTDPEVVRLEGPYRKRGTFGGSTSASTL